MRSADLMDLEFVAEAIKVSDIYTDASLSAGLVNAGLKGLKPSGEFRIPNSSERWITYYGGVETGYSPKHPRLILRPIPKRIVYKFVETGEAPRHLKRGESGVTAANVIMFNVSANETYFNYFPLTLTITEE